MKRAAWWRRPRARLAVSAALLLALVVAAAARSAGWGAPGTWLCIACLLAGAWFWRRGARRSHDATEEVPLEVRARTGLSPRCAIALVEAGSERYLVVHGDGFATVHGMARRADEDVPLPSLDPKVLQAQKGLWQ